MSSASYHGPTPVTKNDIKMAKSHLKATYKLNKQKIKDHKDALKTAQKSDNPKSVNYNKSHLQGHQQDNSKIQTSMKTVKTIKPAVIMPVKQSPGMVSYVKSKKIGAQAMAQGAS